MTRYQIEKIATQMLMKYHRPLITKTIKLYKQGKMEEFKISMDEIIEHWEFNKLCYTDTKKAVEYINRNKG